MPAASFLLRFLQIRKHEAATDAAFAEEAAIRGLPPLLLVLERADCTLEEALAQRTDTGLATRDWRARAPSALLHMRL